MIIDEWYDQVGVFEARCGSLAQYGMKHMRSFANICNAGVSVHKMEEACVAACGDAAWTPLISAS